VKNIYRIIVLSLLGFVAGTASAQTNQPRPADWEKIVEAARKEGKVVASIPPSAELRKLMELAFSKRYGIGVEFVPARGGAIIRRMVDEAKAGAQYFDLHIGGTESVISGLLPENVLEPLEPFLILPEVKDPKQWWGGHIWVDNAKRFVYAFDAYQTVSLWANPNEYKAAEFHSFDDLLNPKLQGKIGISDPRTPGSGSSMWSYMLYTKGDAGPSAACGESGQGENRHNLRYRIFGVFPIHQSRSSASPAAGAQRRPLRQRRLWKCHRSQKSAASQRH